LVAWQQRLRDDDVTAELGGLWINVCQCERAVEAALTVVPDVSKRDFLYMYI